MKFTYEADYPATPEQVMRWLTDKAFIDECERTLETPAFSVEVTSEDDVITTRLERRTPTEGIPSIFKSLVGPEIVIVEVREWTADPDGSGYRGTLAVHANAKSRTARISGRLLLAVSKGGSHFSVDAEIDAQVPLVGKTVRREIAGLAREAFDNESQLMSRRLAGGDDAEAGGQADGDRPADGGDYGKAVA